MTCIVQQYGCSCAPSECQVEHREILEAANSISTARLLIKIFIIFVAVTGFALCGGTMAGLDRPYTQEAAK